MPSYAGEGAKLQIGLESNWGTAVAPTVELDMLSEDFGEEMITKTEETLVGKATTGRTDIMGKKVPGGFSILVKPDNIGLLLACALGAESAATGVGATSTVYDHDFSLITGSATMLPHFTAVVDKRASTKGFVSNKVKQMTFEMGNNDYLKATVETLGYREQADSLESLTLSTLRAFNFNDMTVEIDDTTVDEVLSAKVVINNNLEDDLFVADGSQYMIEPDRQRREVTVELEVLWNDDIETQRDDKYRAGEDVKLELIFTGATAAEGESYQLTFTFANAYYTQAKPTIGGPERMKLPLSLKAASIGSDEPLVVTLRDLQSSQYNS
jgi:hypothetical protein